MQSAQRLSARSGNGSSSSVRISSSSSSLRVAPARRPRAVVVRAAELPKGVSSPTRVPEVPLARFGFVYWAEKINGRAAALGFFGTLIVEAISRTPVLELMGLRVGQGLPFEL
jgi:hypothetical protein